MPDKATHDFQGATIRDLLRRAPDAPSVSEVIPHLHAIATTRVCIDVQKPWKRQFFYKGTSDGVWLQHRIYRGHVHFNDSKGVPRVLRAGVEPCLKLKNTIVPLPRKLKTDLQLNNAADMLGISKSKSARANLNGKELLDKLKVRPMPPASAYYTFRRRLHPLQRADLHFDDRQNLDVNHYDCPTRRGVAGCGSVDFKHPYLGAFEPSPVEWADNISAAPPFKYCRPINVGHPDTPVPSRLRGVSVLLPELHANLNVGHAVKDLVFLAHVLAEQHEAAGTPDAFTVTNVLVEDNAQATGNLSTRQAFLYRKASIEALVAGATPPIQVTYLNQNTYKDKALFGTEPALRGVKTACYELVVQKGLAYAGDWRGATLFRDKVYARCSVEPQAEPDAILLVVHGNDKMGATTRRWHNLKELKRSINARRFRRHWCHGANATAATAAGSAASGQPPCKPLQLLVRAMDGLSFCEQVALYARSKVVFVHHGASLANGYFLRASSLMVEMNRQWGGDRDVNANRFVPTFYGAGYAGLFLSSGVAYIGARVTYGVWTGLKKYMYGKNSGWPEHDGVIRWQMKNEIKYDFESTSMEIAVNASRWAEVLTQIDAMLAPGGDGKEDGDGGGKHPLDALEPPPSPPPPPSPKAQLIPPNLALKLSKHFSQNRMHQLKLSSG